MNQEYLKKAYQSPQENVLMAFTSLAQNADNLIDLSLGNPDLTTPQAIIDAAFKDVTNGHTKYTASAGDPAFIEAVQAYYQKEYQLTFQKNQIHATVGALHAMYLALQVLINPGDEVIIHEPFFSPYLEQVKLAGGVPVIIPTYEKDGFEVDPHILEQSITPKTKIFILNNPNNPTGAVFSRKTLQSIADLAKKKNFYVFSDEVYEQFCFYDEFIPMASLAPEHTITFGSLSKTFAMTGWRIGYMLAPSYINDAANLLNENVTYSAPSPSQRAGVYALNHSEQLISEIIPIFQERLEYIEKRIKEIPFLSLHPLKGGLYAFINIEQTKMPSIEFAKYLLAETNILVIPGKAFGNNGDSFVRVAATQDLVKLEEAFDRIAKLTF